jgi:hypothetical protein
MNLDDSSETVPTRCHHEGDAAHALFVAVAQIALVMRESQGPVAELGSLFARLADTLVVARAAAPQIPRQQPSGTQQQDEPAQPAAASVGPALPEDASQILIQQLQLDVFKGIQQMQFYDRLVQHLTHVQDYLIAVANELDSFKTKPQSQQFWDAVHARLRTRLISDEQRALLDLFLMPDEAIRVSAQIGYPEYSPAGSCEMF